MANILLSPIGRSPGAVTGLYYALQEQTPPVNIDAVILITTSAIEVRDAAKMVFKTIGKDKVHILPLRTQNREKYTLDFDNRDAALDFIMQVNAVLFHARQTRLTDRAMKNQVYIGISAGRSSMGALATLSAYVYGAAGVYHLWVNKEIEDIGDVYNPRVEESLHPDANKRKLIEIPLAPFDQLWDRGRLGEILAERPEAREALQRAVADVDMHELKQLQISQREKEATLEKVTQELRELFKGTEIEKAVGAAIKIYSLSGTDAKPAEVLDLAERLKPIFPPPLWQQIRRDLSDWETLKPGLKWSAERLIECVKMITDPQRVIPIAIALSMF